MIDDDVRTESVIARELRIIHDRDGELTAESVRDAARPETSPLHAHFEWDDGAAAEEYRLEQARRLIRSVRISVVNTERKLIRPRVYVNLPDQGRYVTTEKALADPRMRDVVMAQCLRDLAALKRKYDDLLDFIAVLESYLAEAS